MHCGGAYTPYTVIDTTLGLCTGVPMQGSKDKKSKPSQQLLTHHFTNMNNNQPLPYGWTKQSDPSSGHEFYVRSHCR